MEQDGYKLLTKINSAEDLRKLSIDQLPLLCSELRRDIVNELSVNPGHFASSLGAVELTVALHYVMNTPEDRIVWDVGHQAYGHKILTGRRDVFCTNRKLGGIRPFPSPEESPYDTFACGHASNSISAALGMAVAAERLSVEGLELSEADKEPSTLNPQRSTLNAQRSTLNAKPRHVVAVIGDGAMSGGLAYEGLNNVSSSPNNLLIILNDNDMSIDRSVGGMKQLLLELNTGETYNRLRYKASRWLKGKGYLKDDRRKGLIRLGNAAKSAISGQQNIFEGMNIRYFGPFDGHNVKEIVRLLRQLKDMEGPKLLHLHTKKGYGYKPAEKQATIWHAPGKFNPETGERQKNDTSSLPPKFQDVFGETLLELARQNPRIVGVTPAMPSGCSMNIMMKEMPDRAFDVGIAEGHAVTFSGGMAKDGLLPFCNIYSSFSQRAYDNIIHDVALLNLPVVICLDRAGLVGEDGPTHHGAFDIAALRPIPNLTIAAPMDEPELRRMMYTAQLPDKGPFVIRYPRGRGSVVDWRCPLEEIPIGKGRKLRDGEDVAVLSYGPLGVSVIEALSDEDGAFSDECLALRDERGALGDGEKQDSASGQMCTAKHARQKSVAHYDMRFVKPLDEEILEEVGRKFKRIVTIEDGSRDGGFGSAVLEWMADHGYTPHITRLGLPNSFIEHGTVPEQQRVAGIDVESIRKAIFGLDNCQ
ncbi:1-deoxy-D-xylulose-5-phosphate synthase [Prevotella koreensis]|uniref:1-deoxy-D-xylulose-5-phosphate synthase n=1 Tax=Prevotella koreensis TaxID=2490854 RepID=A0A432LN84_9BACT|nr:1-deoxy-D-xylulose-5-phosphate synthase [Prevotella koreensis]RUL60126.1 1-deoxy-D-xylulose-5-phosphate synthase [Prevotella koreensis]